MSGVVWIRGFVFEIVMDVGKDKLRKKNRGMKCFGFMKEVKRGIEREDL